MRKLLPLLTVLVVLAAAVGFFLLRRSQAVLDAAEVERIASRLLPGARPPQGLKAVLALKSEGLEVAIFAPALVQVRAENLQPGGLRVIIARPLSQQPPQPADLLAQIAQAQNQQAASFDTLSKHPVMLNLGGHKYPAQESELQLNGARQKLREDFTVVPVDQHPVILVVTGTEPDFNQSARDEFLAGLSAPAGPESEEPASPPEAPRPGPPGLPSPPSGGPPRPPGM